MFDFRRITLFCLEKRLSKHKMTMLSKNLGAWLLWPPLAMPMAPIPAFSKQLDTRICPNHNDASEGLSDKYNSKHLLLFKR